MRQSGAGRFNKAVALGLAFNQGNSRDRDPGTRRDWWWKTLGTLGGKMQGLYVLATAGAARRPVGIVQARRADADRMASYNSFGMVRTILKSGCDGVHRRTPGTWADLRDCRLPGNSRGLDCAGLGIASQQKVRPELSRQHVSY